MSRDEQHFRRNQCDKFRGLKETAHQNKKRQDERSKRLRETALQREARLHTE